MEILPLIQGVLLFTGCGFFAIGTLGLFRFSDTLLRVHALTKVDNLGLGFIVLALLFAVPSLAVGIKVVLIWLVALAASATAAHLIGRAVRSQHGDRSTRSESDD